MYSCAKCSLDAYYLFYFIISLSDDGIKLYILIEKNVIIILYILHTKPGVL